MFFSSGKESTFLPLQDMWFEGYFAFESLLNSAHFIRRCGEQLLLQKYENSHFFKEDSSFKLTRKRCIGKNELKIAYTCNHRELSLSFLSSVSCWGRGDFPWKFYRCYEHPRHLRGFPPGRDYPSFLRDYIHDWSTSRKFTLVPLKALKSEENFSSTCLILQVNFEKKISAFSDWIF